MLSFVSSYRGLVRAGQAGCSHTQLSLARWTKLDPTVSYSPPHHLWTEKHITDICALKTFVIIINVIEFLAELILMWRHCKVSRQVSSSSGAVNHILSCSFQVFILNFKKFWPVHMFECINDDWCKVLGEFWPFLLAVLNDVIGQVKESQLAWYLSCNIHIWLHTYDFQD